MAPSLQREGGPPVYGDLIRALTSGMNVFLALLGGCTCKFQPKSSILSWSGF
jgi:hypothetical protein